MGDNFLWELDGIPHQGGLVEVLPTVTLRLPWVITDMTLCDAEGPVMELRQYWRSNSSFIIFPDDDPQNRATGSDMTFESESEIRMSFIGQVCLHIQGICCYRSSTVQQNDRNRTGNRQQKNNIHIGNVQNSKNTIYNTDNYVWTGLTSKLEEKKVCEVNK